jgi:hypothetical protein
MAKSHSIYRHGLIDSSALPQNPYSHHRSDIQPIRKSVFCLRSNEDTAGPLTGKGPRFDTAAGICLAATSVAIYAGRMSDFCFRRIRASPTVGCWPLVIVSASLTASPKSRLVRFSISAIGTRHSVTSTWLGFWDIMPLSRFSERRASWSTTSPTDLLPVLPRLFYRFENFLIRGRLAEVGCSEKQIAAVTGHTTLKEVARYTRAANQERLAADAVDMLTEQKTVKIPKP